MAILVVLNYCILRHPFIICIIKKLALYPFYSCVWFWHRIQNAENLYLQSWHALGRQLVIEDIFGFFWFPLPALLFHFLFHSWDAIYAASSSQLEALFLCEPFSLWVLMIWWMTLHLQLGGITDGTCISIKTPSFHK